MSESGGGVKVWRKVKKKRRENQWLNKQYIKGKRKGSSDWVSIQWEMAEWGERERVIKCEKVKDGESMAGGGGKLEKWCKEFATE